MEYQYDEQIIKKNKKIVTFLILPLAMGFILVACFIDQLSLILGLNLPTSSLKILKVGLFLTGCIDFILLFFLLKIIEKNVKK